MTTIAVMQPYFFPYLGYFQLIAAVDAFILYDQFDYIDRGWVNRNRLLPVDGSPFYFTVPLRKSPSGTIESKQIADEPWRKRILKNIYYNYVRAPFFDEVFPMLEAGIEYETDSLSDLCRETVSKTADFLGIDTEIVSDFRPTWLEERLAGPSEDLTTAFPQIRLDVPSAKVVRIIAICRELDATTFVNPIGGVELYPKEDFRRNGIEVRFLRMRDIRYPQNTNSYRREGTFHPSLSIIDVLMNCGKERTSELLKAFDLE